MRSFKALALVAATSIVTACSGGGGGSTPVNTTKPGTPSQSSAKTAMVTVKFVKPSAKSKIAPTRHGKSRSYVSPNTNGAIVNAVSVGSGTGPTTADNATYYYDLSTDCNAAGTCSLTFPLAPDTYAITVTAYDTAQVSSEATAAGSELSTDTETYTVAANVSNNFNFYLLALVEGFYIPPAGAPETRANHYFGADGAALVTLDTAVATRNRSKQASPTLDSSPSPSPVGTALYEALDPDGYPIDQYGGLYGWALAGPTPSATDSPVPFYAVAVDNGDTTGCATLNGCFTANNDLATAAPAPSASPSTAPIYFPNGGAPAPFVSVTATASSANESFSILYVGGGGPGAGVESWTVANGLPSGSGNPYYGSLSIPNVAGSTFTGSYTVPFAYVVPLYAYVTDGQGNAAGGTTNPNNPFYVWAAQFAPPDGQTSAAYAVTIPAATCEDASGNVLATVGATPGTYYAGYGEVFEVDGNAGSFTGSCLIDVTDGTDTVTYDAFVGTPNTSVAIPAPSSSPTSVQNFAKKR